jgi:hypothetical protein
VTWNASNPSPVVAKLWTFHVRKLIIIHSIPLFAVIARAVSLASWRTTSHNYWLFILHPVDKLSKADNPWRRHMKVTIEFFNSLFFTVRVITRSLDVLHSDEWKMDQ